MKRYIIDRFEGSYAICEQEDKTFVKFLKTHLPINAKEGDVLIKGNDGNFTISEQETELRKERIRRKMNRLFE